MTLPASLRPNTTVIMHVAEMSGPAKSLYPRLAALAELGPLDVVVPSVGHVADLYRGVATIRHESYSALTLPSTVRDGMRELLRFIRDVRTFRQLLGRARPDLVVVVTSVLPAALVAARSQRLPTIVYVGECLDAPPSADDSRRGRLKKRLAAAVLIRLTSLLASVLVCASDTVASQFRRRVGRARIERIYPGVGARESAGERRRLRELYAIQEDALCLAVVGNISFGRGQDVAIRALALLRRRFPDACLLVVGIPHPRAQDQHYRGQLDALTEELQVADAVHFTGFVDAIGDVYAASDIVVNPARVGEGFGRVAVEALRAGRPVVAAAVGAVPEVLRHGKDALLVPPDDAVAIAMACERLFIDRELREKLVRSGKERAEREFGEQAGVNEFLEVAATLLSADRARRHLGRPSGRRS